MDYTVQPLRLKVAKAARYVRLYGVKRTLMKISGQQHMKKDYLSLPAIAKPLATGGRVGLIGCGNFGFSTVAYYLEKIEPGCLRGAMDIDINKAASVFERFKLKYYTTDAEEIITDPEIKLIYVASNHASHAEYAIRCINAGKHVHIEKPHVVDAGQLERLMAAMQAKPEVKVFLGFNRPRSPLFKSLTEVLAAETGPTMINWFIAGHAIEPGHWYFDAKEGGRVLGNLCHWTDLTLQLVGQDAAFPCTIMSSTPVDSASDFVVSVIFADQSCAAITFSAKGHTFEGVREVLNLHKGNLLANLTDFQKLSIDIGSRRHRRTLRYREHGHEANIHRSFFGLQPVIAGESQNYLKATAVFFLMIKKAIDTGERVTISRQDVQP